MSMKFRNGSKSTSQIAHAIEIATDSSVNHDENWAQFMTICDAINATDDGPKEAIKAVRKRLSCKQPANIMLTLKLLETFVKNCGLRFHVYVATKDFMQEMIKIMSPKYNPSVELQNTVLGLIQTWATAFQSQPELKEVSKTYADLKAKGIEFPAFDPDQASQIFIPSKSATPVAATEIPIPRAGRSSSTPMWSPTGQRPVHHQMQSPGRALPQQSNYSVSVAAAGHVSKLQSDLSVVQQNCQVFGDMLTEINSGNYDASDVQLIEDLNATCREMQKRIVKLIESSSFEDLTDELLNVNDNLNNVFLRYDRYKRLAASRNNMSQLPSEPEQESEPFVQSSLSGQMTAAQFVTSSHSVDQQQQQQQQQQQLQLQHGAQLVRHYPTEHQHRDDRISGGVAVGTLIDFGADNDLSTTMQKTSLAGGRDTSQTWLQSLPEQQAADRAPSLPTNPHNTEMEEMERWLMTNPGGDENATTTAEFDQFLMNRARDTSASSSLHSASGQTHQQPSEIADLVVL